MGPVKPGKKGTKISGLDRSTAPDAQARRRVAVGGDVIGRAFGFQESCEFLRGLGLGRLVKRREPGGGDGEADGG